MVDPSAPLELRRLTSGDVPACERVAVEHGWEVGEARWRLMLGLGEGWGCFAPGAGLVGTTLLFDYQHRVALVAMVLVRKAFGRRGVARRLVERAMAGAPPATCLYATAQGRALYERMGFVAGEHLSRYSGRPREVPAEEASQLRPLQPGDLAAAVALDAEAFGAARPSVLAALHGCAAGALGAWRGGQLVGYGIATEVGAHLAVGPVAALEEPVGVQLVGALAHGRTLPVRVDAPAARDGLRGWAVRAGLAQEAAVPLMTSGGLALPGRRERLVAVASRGLG